VFIFLFSLILLLVLQGAGRCGVMVKMMNS